MPRAIPILNTQRLLLRGWRDTDLDALARAALNFGFESAGLREIVAMTVPANVASQRVMDRLSMTHDPAEDFDHPTFTSDHPLCR